MHLSSRLIALVLASMLAACAGVAPWVPDGTPAADAARYRCDGGLLLAVRFVDDSARLVGLPTGPEDLLRDAGGVTPMHSVFSNPRWRAEFGVGPDGRDAVLHPVPAWSEPVRCTRT